MFYFDPGSECRSSSVTGFLSPLFPNVSLTEDEADLPSDKMENAEAPYEAPAPRLVAAAWRKTSVVWQIRNSYVTAASDTDLPFPSVRDFGCVLVRPTARTQRVKRIRISV